MTLLVACAVAFVVAFCIDFFHTIHVRAAVEDKRLTASFTAAVVGLFFMVNVSMLVSFGWVVIVAHCVGVFCGSWAGLAYYEKD